MRILYVLPFFTPKRGGSVTVPYQLSEEMAKKGHKVTIITTDFEFDEKYAQSLEFVEVVSFKCVARIGLFLYSPGIVKWLDANIKRFDIVHMHNFRSYQNNAVRKYAKKYNVPYILQAHGSLLPSLGKQNLKKLYDYLWGDNILKDATKVIGLSETELKQYIFMGVHEEKIELVPNGINLNDYYKLPNFGQFKEKYGINHDEKIVLYVGRLNDTKGIDLLVKAFYDLSRELNNIRLIFVGPDDGYQSSLIYLIKSLNLTEKVTFAGFVDKNDKIAAFVDADVFVTPRFSGFPVTFVESCACGTPIITTNQSDSLGWIDKNVGYVVDFDRNELKNAIRKILNQSSLRKQFSTNCKIIVERQFNWSLISNSLLNIYIETIKSYGPQPMV